MRSGLEKQNQARVLDRFGSFDTDRVSKRLRDRAGAVPGRRCGQKVYHDNLFADERRRVERPDQGTQENSQ